MKDMKIEKRIYKIFYKGKQYCMPLSVSPGVLRREKVRVRSSKLNIKHDSSFLIPNS